MDLDDTLLGPDKQISAANAAAVQALRDRGVRIVLASGRRHENMLGFHQQLGLDGPIVSCNGALVQHAETGEVLHRHVVPPDLAAEILADGSRRGVTQNYYHTDGRLYVRERTPWTDLYQSRTGSEMVWYGDLTRLAGDAPLKIIWVMDASDVAALFPLMERRYAGRLYVTVTDAEFLEFMALGVNKGVGLQSVARFYGITAEETIAFGDGNNDVPMLEWAGLGVAMASGRESAKTAARLVSPPGSPETSLARAIASVLQSTEG